MKPLSFLLLLTCLSNVGFAQTFPIDSLPKEGVLLDKGWKFHAGDNPDFAKADFDDSKWESIDPTKDIMDLPQIFDSNIKWLRLDFVVKSKFSEPIGLAINQVGASEIHLNGYLVKQIGHFDVNLNKVVANSPLAIPFYLPVDSVGKYTLAIRYVLQPNIHYTKLFNTSSHFFEARLVPLVPALNSELNSKSYSNGLDIFKFGIFLILFILHAAFYFNQKNDKAHFLLTLIFLSLATGHFLIIVGRYYFNIPELFWYSNLFSFLYLLAICLQLAVLYYFAKVRLDFSYSIVTVFAFITEFSVIFNYNYGDFSILLFNIISLFFLLRITIIGSKKKIKGFKFLSVGVILSILAVISFGLYSFKVLKISIYQRDLIYNVCYMAFPIGLSIYMGLKSSYTNKELTEKLIENEILKEKAVNQEKEKQQILATQNETLERQVTERTAELKHKNRELEIEAALDKVRSRSLAMHKSDELQEVVVVVFEKLKELGLVFDGGAGIQLFTEGSKNSTLWVAAPGQITSPSQINLPYDADGFRDNPIILDVWTAKETGEAIYNKTYTRDEKNRYFEYVFKHNDLIQVPLVVRDEIMQAPSYTQAFVTEKNSGVIANSWSNEVFPPDKFDVFKRIAKVFDQAYTRFLDLQKSEAQAREAQIEVALERVRSRTMAMQRSSELAEAASVLFQQINDLGYEMWSCGFCIWKQDDFSELWMSADSGGLLPPMLMPYKEEPTHRKIYEASLRQEPVHEYVWKGKELKKHYEYLYTIPSVKEAIDILEKSGLSLPAKQCYYAGFFNQGYLLIITKEPIPEMHDLSYRFTRVFEQTYTRFLDLQKAEAQAEQARLNLIQIQTEKKRAEDALHELRITQAQLIQKEKLASLGELTAGIAHEIQNPLNFVNNFSEVSTELVDELKEGPFQKLPDAEKDYAEEILGDLTQNLTKITHHGGRASAIVKGMLEHSRASTGERTPTNLNALADEYLRLAYQGLRAKTKDFNCELVTDFAPDLGPVAVIPQEIGRVLLNLYNNAFYAIHEKQKIAPADYQPTVTVGTRFVAAGSPEGATSLANPNGFGGVVEIHVRDNGGGIPDGIRDKIFQPFFTTKPTGEGTGLGLSLSYDIVTKGHGGTMEVESREGEGVQFIVYLPY